MEGHSANPRRTDLMDFFSQLRQSKAAAGKAPQAQPPAAEQPGKSQKRRRSEDGAAAGGKAQKGGASSSAAPDVGRGAAAKPQAAKARRLSLDPAAQRKPRDASVAPVPRSRDKGRDGEQRQQQQPERPPAARGGAGDGGAPGPSGRPPTTIRAHPFQTEYGDHFETSTQAFEDLVRTSADEPRPRILRRSLFVTAVRRRAA